MMEIDKDGLDHTDRQMLLTIIQKFGGGPVGLDTLAATIGGNQVPLRMSTSPTCYKKDFAPDTLG